MYLTSIELVWWSCFYYVGGFVNVSMIYHLFVLWISSHLLSQWLLKWDGNVEVCVWIASEITVPYLVQWPYYFTNDLIVSIMPDKMQSSLINFLIQTASLAALLVAIYSSSVVQSLNVSCFKLFELKTPPFWVKHKSRLWSKVIFINIEACISVASYNKLFRTSKYRECIFSPL